MGALSVGDVRTGTIPSLLPSYLSRITICGVKYFSEFARYIRLRRHASFRQERRLKTGCSCPDSIFQSHDGP
ncbi:MAG: hypothetical protein V1736_10210 [Pseudomonadota bacterium]